MTLEMCETTTTDDERRTDVRAAPLAAVELRDIAFTDAAIEYCLALAHHNMQPYLERRGRSFDDEHWRQMVSRARFFLIDDRSAGRNETVGFLSVRDEADAPQALHIGDIQLQADCRNRGIGTAVLQQVEVMARAHGRREITLNVFHDNPAIRLYERAGFRTIDRQFDKFKMRKALRALVREDE